MPTVFLQGLHRLYQNPKQTRWCSVGNGVLGWLRVIPFLIPCLSHQRGFFGTGLVSPALGRGGGEARFEAKQKGQPPVVFLLRSEGVWGKKGRFENSDVWPSQAIQTAPAVPMGLSKMASLNRPRSPKVSQGLPRSPNISQRSPKKP